ncbi:hypothetical protein O0L34_g1770 [Tuta absoluta]|nr:hypothetical protein O0L34_g1770 [Tuta absoluta]
MSEEVDPTEGLAAFALVYLTFFLDNVLLTVLVPIIPDWVRGGEALQLWAQHDAPLVSFLNSTVHQMSREQTRSVVGIGRAQATVGAVLGAKAAVQLAVAGPAACAVCRLGPAKVLRAANILLALAALVFWACSVWRGASVALTVGIGRAVHGAGAAMAGVSGLALAAAALPSTRSEKALSALLGAVALGVLVGYPFGGAASSVWRPGTPFLLLAMAFVVNLGLQYMFLDRKRYNLPAESSTDENVPRFGFSTLVQCARRGAVGACAGCVLLTTSVMAALEPCLPLWLAEQFDVKPWQTGVAFIPDSTGYLLAASTLGGYARKVGAERVALAGQILVGVAAMCVPLAASPWALAPPQFLLGAGLGAVDAALVPALLSHVGPRKAAARAALFQGASSAAYAVGPAVGGAAAWAAGVPTALRALGFANLLYAVWLYRILTRYPLSEHWGATVETDSETEDAELAPLQYSQIH